MKIPLVKMWTECEKPESNPRNSLAKEKKRKKLPEEAKKVAKQDLLSREGETAKNLGWNS